MNTHSWLENTGSIEGTVMSTTENTLPKFAVGSRVRVKKGVVSPQHPDLPLGGWTGKVYEVRGNICFVHRDRATLEAVGTIHRDGMDSRAMWLQEKLLEADPGEPLCIEQGCGVEAIK